MAHEITHEPDAFRYTLTFDGELACVVDYTVNGDAIALTRTYTPPSHRGHGYAGQLVEYVVNDIESTTDSKVVPSCSYVSDWFDKHPERSAMLTR
ncbi:MAG: acetyltransferase [Cryobacterium sp.]|nr:acetyltransferase [Cryobacterium sp.]